MSEHDSQEPLEPEDRGAYLRPEEVYASPEEQAQENKALDDLIELGKSELEKNHPGLYAQLKAEGEL